MANSAPRQPDPAATWLTTKEAAIYTRRSESNLEKRRWAGLPPVYHKAGKLILYARAELDSWIRASAGA